MYLRKLLIAIPILSIILTNLAIASTDTQRAKFRVATYGRCLVQVDVPPFDPFNPEYTLWESPVGIFNFAGKASTEYGIDEDLFWSEIPGYDGEWCTITPETLEAFGHVKVSWSHEGIDYEIKGNIYPRSTTYGLLEPDQDILRIKGPEGAMDFIGTFRAGSQIMSLQCSCTFTVEPSLLDSGYITLVRIQFPGWPTTIITIYWFEAGLEYGSMSVPAALLFLHEVSIKNK